jgi:hypothetical protein
MSKGRRQNRAGTMHIARLSVRYTDEELLDVLRQLHESRKTSRGIYTCMVEGYDDDPRGLYEIPEVRQLCQRLVALGFISELDVTTSMKGLTPAGVPGMDAGLGAFGVWALSRGLIKAPGTTAVPESTLREFFEVLKESNQRADRHLGVKPAARREDQLDRKHLLDFNVERIEQAYLGARGAGLFSPVVLVVDTRDRVGGRIARALRGEGAVEQFKSDMEAKGAVPTLILALGHTDAVRVIGKTTSRGERTLRSPLPPGTFWVVVMANGGNAYAAHRIPE